MYIPLGQDPIHIVVGGQEQLGLIRLHGFITAQKIRMFQQNDARLASDEAARSLDGRGGIPDELHTNL